MEFGGYLEFENFNGNILHDDGIALNSGRSCLAYLFECKHISKIYLPYLTCDSTENIIQKYNIDFEYYHIDSNFHPIIDFNLHDDEYIYLINYYGLLSREYCKKIVGNQKNIIMDNVQCYFESAIKGVDTIYSCRKFFGVPDGAFLYTTNSNNLHYEREIVNRRIQYLFGRMEESAKKYYYEYKKNEDSFYDKPILRMSKVTENILRAINYTVVKNKRTENFNYVKNRLSKYNKLSINTIIGPYAYPLLLDNGFTIKQALAKEQVYIPTLWPNVLNNCSKQSLEYNYAANILPIPIDQRYTISDMESICDIIEKKIVKSHELYPM